MTLTILIADEDEATRTFLADNLAADGYRVLVAADRPGAVALLNHQPDLVLVDVNGETLGLVDAVRSGDGFAARVDTSTPLMVTTSRADELHRVRLFEHGTDDVIQKPFSYPELRARIAAVLRRSERHRSTGVLRAGPLKIHVDARQVLVGDRMVELSLKEYELLLALADQPTRVCSRRELIEAVWGYEPRGTCRTLDSHASRLRGKLQAVCEIKLVINSWGHGYKLMEAAGVQ